MAHLLAAALCIIIGSSPGASPSQATGSDGANCEAERRLCRNISYKLDRINRMPYHVATEESCSHIKKVCHNVKDDINQLEGTGLLASEMYQMYRACLPLLKGDLCGDTRAREETQSMEIDVGKMVWQARSNEVKYFGKILKVLPPRIEAEGWEYQYARGNGTVGTKKQTLLVLYRYKRRPDDWREALRKVGLPTDVPPLDFGTSLIWPAKGTKSQPITFHGKVLNRVIVAKDLSEITIDGHEPGNY